MKKIFLLYITGGLFTGLSFAQTGVGINTDTPLGPFHVDAKGDTSGTTNASDDVLVTADGKLGIGTVRPVEKVHIQSTSGTGLRLSDQSEAAGSMLMSRDNLGTATWMPKPFTVKEGKIWTRERDPIITWPPVNNFENKGRNYLISDANTPMKLPPGVWMIMAKYLMQGSDAGNMYWTYLHDLDDTEGLTPDADNEINKRKQYLSDGSLNPNWVFNPSTSSLHAMSVVGIYPEPTGSGYTTPTLNYIAVIQSPGKNPGDDGYEHEIILSYSSSTKNQTACVAAIRPDTNDPSKDVPVGVYFFAIRLDVDDSSL